MPNEFEIMLQEGQEMFFGVVQSCVLVSSFSTQNASSESLATSPAAASLAAFAISFSAPTPATPPLPPPPLSLLVLLPASLPPQQPGVSALLLPLPLP